MATKVEAADVIRWFEGASQEMRGLVLSIISDKMAAADKRREELSKRLSKARAAKGKGKRPTEQAAPAAQVAAPAAQPRRQRNPNDLVADAEVSQSAVSA